MVRPDGSQVIDLQAKSGEAAISAEQLGALSREDFSEFNKRLGHLGPDSALRQGPLNLGGGKPRSLELEEVPMSRTRDRLPASNGVRNAVGTGSGEDHTVRMR